MDLELAAATAPTQVVAVSVHQSLVEEPPTIVEGQAPTMDIVTTVPLCAPLITCVHASPLGVTSNQMLVSSTSTPAPLLLVGPSCPPVTQGPISLLPGAPISLHGAPGMQPAPYRASVCRQRCTAPYTVLEFRPTVLGCCQRHAVPCRAPHFSP